MNLTLHLRLRPSAPTTSLCSMSSRCPTPALPHGYVEHLVGTLSHVLDTEEVAAVLPRGAEDHAGVGLGELYEDG